MLRDNVHNKKILLNKQFFRDLFPIQYDSVTFYDETTCHSEVHLDVFLTGLGAIFENMVYNLPIPKNYMNYNILQHDILNILVACKVWAGHWANKSINIWCNNLAVVEVLNSGKSCDPILATCARNIWLLSAIHNFQTVVHQIPGRINITADLLSR